MAKKEYVRPVIRKQYMGAANKFGGYSIPEPILSIDGVAIEDIMKKYGSPVFVFSEANIRAKARELNQAFQSRYPQFQLAWSYKTNYLNSICKIFHEEGSWAEVVSGFEYQKARNNGIPGNRILFNGPYKPYPILKQAVNEGARIHVDHLDEIMDLIKISEELNRPVDVTLRLNMDTGMYPVWSRFGFSLETGHALEAARKIAYSGGKLRIIGVHSHIGTFVMDVNPYKRAAKKLAEFYKKLRDELKQPLQYLDMGGGFPSANKLKYQYSSDSTILPSFDAYAEAICSTLYDSFSPEEPPPLFLETGRALIDEAGYLLTSIVGSKTMPNGKRSHVLDGGVNLLYTSTWYDYKIRPTKEYSSTYEDVTLFGPLCMNIDIVRESCLLPAVKRGDVIALHPVGAYNVTQWMQFIEMRPPIILVTEQGETKLLRKRESMETLNQMEE